MEDPIPTVLRNIDQERVYVRVDTTGAKQISACKW